MVQNVKDDVGTATNAAAAAAGKAEAATGAAEAATVAATAADEKFRLAELKRRAEEDLQAQGSPTPAAIAGRQTFRGRQVGKVPPAPAAEAQQ